MWQAGDQAFIVVSNRQVREVRVLSRSGGFCTVRIEGSGADPGAIRLRDARLFQTCDKAQATIRQPALRKPDSFI